HSGLLAFAELASGLADADHRCVFNLSRPGGSWQHHQRKRAVRESAARCGIAREAIGTVSTSLRVWRLEIADGAAVSSSGGAFLLDRIRYRSPAQFAARGAC